MLVSQLGFSHNLLPLICLTDIDRPKGLAFTDVDVDSIKIAWESPQGQVSRYRVTYSSPEDGIHELFPAPDGEEDTAELQGLRPGSEYTVSVVALHDDMESQPLIGIQSTGISLTNCTTRVLTGAAALCPADIILSWAIDSHGRECRKNALKRLGKAFFIEEW